MEIWKKIIEAHGPSGVRTHNQIRLSLTLIGPVFIAIGLLGLLGFGGILSDGIFIVSHDPTITYAIFLAIGIVAQISRSTIFREKRSFNKKRT